MDSILVDVKAALELTKRYNYPRRENWQVCNFFKRMKSNQDWNSQFGAVGCIENMPLVSNLESKVLKHKLTGKMLKRKRNNVNWKNCRTQVSVLWRPSGYFKFIQTLGTLKGSCPYIWSQIWSSCSWSDGWSGCWQIWLWSCYYYAIGGCKVTTLSGYLSQEDDNFNFRGGRCNV